MYNKFWIIFVSQWHENKSPLPKMGCMVKVWKPQQRRLLLFLDQLEFITPFWLHFWLVGQPQWSMYGFLFKIYHVIFILHWSLKVDKFYWHWMSKIKIFLFFLLLVELCLFTVGVLKREKNKDFLELLFTNNIYMKKN